MSTFVREIGNDILVTSVDICVLGRLIRLRNCFRMLFLPIKPKKYICGGYYNRYMPSTENISLCDIAQLEILDRLNQ